MSTSQKVSNEEKRHGGFSPVTVQESPVSKTPQRGNLTGNARVLRDCVADTYNLIQKWNAHQILGGRIIKNIVTLKTNFVNEGTSEDTHIYQEGLQEHCDQLNEVCAIMHEVVAALKLIYEQVGAIIKLENLNNKEKTPLFISWPVEKFGEALHTIYDAYAEELKVKLCVKENIAHAQCKPSLMLHAAAWAQQPYITSRTDLTVESLLLETGQR